MWLGDIPVAVITGGPGTPPYVFWYLHADHLNTPRSVENPTTGELVWRWDSAPFGETAPNEDPDGDFTLFSLPLRFPGQYADQETGLHYNYFRDYEPQTGRYVQSDPIGLAAGTNPFGYAFARATNVVDPFGLNAYENEFGGPCPILTWPSYCEFVPDSGQVHEDPTSERRKIQIGSRRIEGLLPSWQPTQGLPSPLLVRRGIMPNPGLQIGPTGQQGMTYEFVVEHRWGRYEIRFERFQTGRCKCFDECNEVQWFSGAKNRLPPIWKPGGEWSEWHGI